MPVLGMMSVFDWSEADNVKGGWTGREWFVVNKARFVVLVAGAILFFSGATIYAIVIHIHILQATDR